MGGVAEEGECLLAVGAGGGEGEDVRRDGVEGFEVEDAGESFELAELLEDVEAGELGAVFADERGQGGVGEGWFRRALVVLGADEFSPYEGVGGRKGRGLSTREMRAERGALCRFYALYALDLAAL